MFDSLKCAIDNITQEGPVLELGVHEGTTLAQITKYCHEKDIKDIHGFDCWTGLPEAWLDKDGQVVGRGVQGRFATNGPPNIPGVRYWNGLFDDTLPDFLSEISPKQFSFVNIDCDLYSSTVDILKHIGHLFAKGTVIRLDDWFYKHSLQHKEGEQKAFLEWCEEKNVNYRQLYYQVNSKQDEESTVLIIG